MAGFGNHTHFFPVLIRNDLDHDDDVEIYKDIDMRSNDFVEDHVHEPRDDSDSPESMFLTVPSPVMTLESLMLNEDENVWAGATPLPVTKIIFGEFRSLGIRINLTTLQLDCRCKLRYRLIVKNVLTLVQFAMKSQT